MTASSPSAAARAGANFALVKYWGKRDTALNLPAVGSISLTLADLWTETRVEFDPQLSEDEVVIDSQSRPAEARRVSACLDRLRDLAGVETRARVASHSNFPAAAGLASSASGFAALVCAAAAALELELKPARLSELARLGSGSAARSIFGGFVEMARGRRTDGRDSVARPLLAPADWPLEVVVAVTDPGPKPVGSTEGMLHSARTSPYYSAWVKGQEADLAAARRAIAGRDFEALAAISEASALSMHAVAMAARPGLLYWNATTLECLHHIRAMRDRGMGVFFTVDAGPQVKAVCLPGAGGPVAAELAAVAGVKEVRRSRLGEGVVIRAAGKRARGA